MIILLNKLKELAILRLEEDLNNNSNLNSNLNNIKKSLNKKINKIRNKNLESFNINELEEEETEEEKEEEEEESINLFNSLSSFSSSSSFNSISSSNSNNILNQIKNINKSNNKISSDIKDKLLELLLLICKQETNLYIFDNSINSFFASKSIRENKTIRDSLDLSQFYSKFIYSIQLLVIEDSFRKLLNNKESSLLDYIKDFMTSYFNNSSATALGKILNNRSYAFKVNKESSSLSNIIISTISKETISYNKVTITIDNLRKVFKELIYASNTFLKEQLLFNISKREYKDVTLEEFSPLEDINNNTPYKCFKDFHLNIEYYNLFLYNKVLSTLSLRRKFFNIKDNKLELNKNKIKDYTKDLLDFLKYCLLLIYFTSGLPLRGTEIPTLRFLNLFKDLREIFLDKGSNLFILNISYYKAQANSEKQASSIRYLPRSVSNIFLIYIVLITPFVDFLNIASSSSSNISLSPYFFYINKRVLES